MFVPGIDEACFLVPGADEGMEAVGDWLDEALVAPGVPDGPDGESVAGLVIATRAGGRGWVLSPVFPLSVPL